MKGKSKTVVSQSCIYDAFCKGYDTGVSSNHMPKTHECTNWYQAEEFRLSGQVAKLSRLLHFNEHVLLVTKRWIRTVMRHPVLQVIVISREPLFCRRVQAPVIELN